MHGGEAAKEEDILRFLHSRACCNGLTNMKTYFDFFSAYINGDSIIRNRLRERGGQNKKHDFFTKVVIFCMRTMETSMYIWAGWR